MSTIAWRRHRLLNLVQSLLLLAGMALVAGALGWVVAGPAGAAWALVLAALLTAFNPQVSPRLVLRLYQAEPLPPSALPELHRAVAELARRAGLARPPALHHVPSNLVNAFAVGTRRRAAIAVTDAMLRTLTPRELVAVLAHEISHIRHNDLWVMGLADLFSRVTSAFSTLGQVLLLANLPLILFSDYSVSWIAILVLVFAPMLSLFMQLALSRTREHDADAGAVALTGDPDGLASALQRMERFQGRLLEQVVAPGRHLPDPSLLRTHPHTEERIRRLYEMAPAATPVTPPASIGLPDESWRPARRTPRWYPTGVWR